MPPIYSKEWTTCPIHVRGDGRQGRTSPCETACPAGNPIQRLHSLTQEGRMDEALSSLLARNPFPGVTGRVCPHPCETACNRCNYDEALATHSLERFAADSARPRVFHPLEASGKRVAVVGSGPAGMTAAWFLALFGHGVTVYERSPVMGGVPRQAVPDFRLPKDVVDRETGAILDMGVRVRTNVAIGRDVALADILAAHDACILATGQWKERRLDIPGKEFLTPAISWLRSTTLERDTLKGRTVVILGGGGVALDCAFTARRLHADAVHLVFLEPADAMRVPTEEVEQAHAEGLRLHAAHLSTAVRQQGKGYEVEAAPVSSFSFDDAGVLHTTLTDGPALRLEADMVICASGLQSDLTCLGDAAVALTPRGCVAADPLSGETSLPGLYAAGDIATGPSLIAAAVGHGRKVAIAVHKRLSGLAATVNADYWIDSHGQVHQQTIAAQPEPHVVELTEIMNLNHHVHAARRRPAAPADSGPELAFAELVGGFSPDEARAEAERCLHCGHCMSCGSCVESCPGHILEMTDDGPRVAYPDQCWHCGCCRIACPVGAIAYRFPLTMML